MGQQGGLYGECLLPYPGCEQIAVTPADPELETALAMSMAGSSGNVHEDPVESGLEIPVKEHQQQMLEQVMAMGFDAVAARNALEATAWTSVEGAIGVLFG